MNTKYLIGSIVFLTLLSVSALVLFMTHWQFRHAVGHDKFSFDKFAARVESGNLNPETMMRFTNSWFEAQKQDHQVIQAEEIVSDRLAERVLVLGVLGLFAVVFQSYVIFSMRNQSRRP